MKKMRKLLRIVFGRTTFFVLFLLIQIGYFFGIVEWLSGYSLYVYAFFDLLGGFLCIYIMNKKDNPSFKLAWMIPVLVFPIFGALLYLYVELEISGRLIAKRAGEIERQSRRYLAFDEAVFEKLENEDRRTANLARYMEKRGGFPIRGNTKATYFPSGQDKFKQLKEELEKAKRFIFMEYFIVEEGVMWDGLLEILERKAKEGVEVRFMYDGMCAISLLPYGYPEQLKKFGIKCKMANAVKPFLSTTQNNRDHRKICVIDGKTAFTGGVNLADEYINKIVRFGHWKDTAVMLKGDAVQSFTMMFLEMWNVTERRPENYQRYLTPKRKELKREYGYVIPYADSPFDNENVGEEVYFHILNHAKKYVHIMTPYLILDNEMITTLTRVAKSGIEVVIIMPHIPDKWYAFVLAQTYYQELIESGVQIYEYTPGFVHAKVFVSDDDTATVGTINLDYRSLYLHFECGTFIYNNSEIGRIENDFQKTLLNCHKVTLMEVKNRTMLAKVMGQVLRLAAPLM